MDPRPRLLLRALGKIGDHRGVRTEHRINPAAGAARKRDLVGQIDLTDEIGFETAECRRLDRPQDAGGVEFLHRRFGQATQPLGLLLTGDKPGSMKVEDRRPYGAVWTSCWMTKTAGITRCRATMHRTEDWLAQDAVERIGL
jgi:hypothetical protein